MTTANKKSAPPAAAPKTASLPGPQPTQFVEATSTQSMHFLMVAAQKLGLLIYRGPVDLRNVQQVRTTIVELWPDMKDQMGNTRAVNAKKKFLPQDDGQYYHVIINSDDGERLDVLIPEGDVVPQVFILAVKAGKAEALRVLYRYGILPKA